MSSTSPHAVAPPAITEGDDELDSLRQVLGPLPHASEETLRRCLGVIDEADAFVVVPAGAVPATEVAVDKQGARLLLADGVTLLPADGWFTRLNSPDATLHCEAGLLELARASLSAAQLAGCTFFAAQEPCLACAALLEQSDIRNFVFANLDPRPEVHLVGLPKVAGAVTRVFSEEMTDPVRHCPDSLLRQYRLITWSMEDSALVRNERLSNADPLKFVVRDLNQVIQRLQFAVKVEHPDK